MRNGFQYRVRTNAAVFALALAMVGGVSLVENSALFALSPMAPLMIVGTIAFVFATLNGDRWALAVLFVAAVLVFSVDLRPDLPKDDFVRPRDSDGLEMLKFAVFMLAFLGGAAALRAQLGSASCRERVCQYVWISVVAVYLKKKTKKTT